MIDKIVERIISYTTSVNMPVNCVEFGDKLPAPPYVVVKEEQDPIGRGMQFRIISHFAPNMKKLLRNFNRATIGEALDDFKATDDDGNYNYLNKDSDSFSGLIVTNDDGTISSERIYYMCDYI